MHVLAFILGTYWLTRQTARALRWAIENTPSHDEARSVFPNPRSGVGSSFHTVGRRRSDCG